MSDSPFDRPPLESVEKGLLPDKEIPGVPADGPRFADMVREINLVKIQPGDVVVLKTSRELAERDVEWLREQLKGAFPTAGNVLILHHEMDLSVVRPEERS